MVFNGGAQVGTQRRAVTRTYHEPISPAHLFSWASVMSEFVSDLLHRPATTCFKKPEFRNLNDLVLISLCLARAAKNTDAMPPTTTSLPLRAGGFPVGRSEIRAAFLIADPVWEIRANCEAEPQGGQRRWMMFSRRENCPTLRARLEHRGC